MSFRVKLRLKALKGIFPALRALPEAAHPAGCAKCGIRFNDAMGRPVALGYVCGRATCPAGLGGASGTARGSIASSATAVAGLGLCLLLSACAPRPQPFGENVWRAVECTQKGTC